MGQSKSHYSVHQGLKHASPIGTPKPTYSNGCASNPYCFTLSILEGNHIPPLNFPSEFKARINNICNTKQNVRQFLQLRASNDDKLLDTLGLKQKFRNSPGSAERKNKRFNASHRKNILDDSFPDSESAFGDLHESLTGFKGGLIVADGELSVVGVVSLNPFFDGFVAVVDYAVGNGGDGREGVFDGRSVGFVEGERNRFVVYCADLEGRRDRDCGSEDCGAPLEGGNGH